MNTDAADALPHLSAAGPGARVLQLSRRLAQDDSVRALVYLRWVALAGMLLTTVAVGWIWRVRLPFEGMGLVMALIAASNLLVGALDGLDRARLAGAALLFDVVALTALLAMSGGPANPFTVLYALLVMVAAIMSSRGWTWTLVVASSLGFAALFWVSAPLPPELGGHRQAGGSYAIHLQGMWLAYVVAAGAVGLFVSRLSDALRAEHKRQERASRLLGLAALAAGAAHEIGNPLGTIRIAADELEAELSQQGADQGQLEDLRLICAEVARAKAVLDRMSAAAGELRGEALRHLPAAEILQRAVHLAGDGQRVRMQLAADLPQVRWPAEATSQALCQVVRNALQASPPGAEVLLSAELRGHGIQLQVEDQGEGIDPRLVARIGEPFFTTRAGEGTGLGVFVARSLIEQLGGRMALRSRPAEGTTVSLWLPLQVAT